MLVLLQKSPIHVLYIKKNCRFVLFTYLYHMKKNCFLNVIHLSNTYRLLYTIFLNFSLGTDNEGFQRNVFSTTLDNLADGSSSSPIYIVLHIIPKKFTTLLLLTYRLSLPLKNFSLHSIEGFTLISSMWSPLIPYLI